jgi:general secretion pathway protein J
VARRCRFRGSGFTLVEVVISLALLALLILGAHTAIRTSTQAVASGERLIERTNKLRVTQELLRRQLSQALAMPIEQRRGTNESIFLSGGRDELTWVSAMPGYLGRGGPYVQRISLERGPGGPSLVFRHAMLNGWDPDDGFDERGAPPVTLLEGIRDLRIEYRALDDAGRLGSWQDRWDKPFQLPLLVRIRIEFDRESQQQWPELVIPLLVDPGAGAMNVAPIFGPRG